MTTSTVYGVRCVLAAAMFWVPYSVLGACSPCGNYQAGVDWGTATLSALTEASGIAVSGRNAGVVWTHNDGTRGKLYALSTNAVPLATFNFNEPVNDLEDLAIGPGPVPGMAYLYVGDIGGSGESTGLRAQVKVLRVAEPAVSLSWAGNPVTDDFDGVEAFTLAYPDGSFDAETLLVDPVSADVVVVTKGVTARVYRANLTHTPGGSTVALQLAGTVGFSNASGGDISADGTRIVLRRENYAMVWARCDGEPLAAALARNGVGVPLIGLPTEPNGEGIGFLRDGSGYVTISEGASPHLYFFRSLCPAPPQWVTPPADQKAFAGGAVTFSGFASGYPAPAYTWFFGSTRLVGRTNSLLVLTNLTLANAGLYSVTASNVNGTASASATLTVNLKPDLRITEVESSQAPNASVKAADWWELTSFESQPVSLKGWRFNDSAGGLTDPYTITNDLVIGPGESIVFVEDLSASKFLKWWGSNHFSASFQIVTYSGSGLGLAAEGDGLRLWSEQASVPGDTIAAVDFGIAETGVSFNYEPITGSFGAKSQLGSNGVFQADTGGDLGSPGRILAPPSSPRLQGLPLGDKFRLQFTGAVGRDYILEVRSGFGAQDDSWTRTGDVLHATNNQTLFFEKRVAGGNRFYRVTVQ